MGRAKAVGLVVVVVALSAGLLPSGRPLVPPAAANHGPEFFPRWWSPPAPVFFYFRDNFPGGAYRQRLINGFEQWNVHNQTLRWFQGGFDLGWYSTACADLPPQRNGVWWVSLPQTTLGRTFVCPVAPGSPLIKAVTVEINSTTNWYTGTVYPASNQYDLWSTATHEVGHASGFYGSSLNGGHWDDAAGICQWPAAGNNYHTMCSRYQPVGVQVQRDTEVHTETAFDARY
jgi:hypothetical protein